MEAELLRGMIADREQRISNIQRKTADNSAKEQRLLAEYDQVHQEKVDQSMNQQTERTMLLREEQKALASLAAVQQELQQQGASLQTYAGVLNAKTAHDAVAAGDASYVMRMQAQLCKAMHSMGIIDHQMDTSKQHANDIIKLQKDSIALLTEEKSQIELKLMNELMKLDTVKREIEGEALAKLDAIRRDMVAVEEQLGDEEEGEDDEGDEGNKEGGEEDDEERNAKERLMQMLQEKRQEIERIEKEMEEKEEMLDEYREYDDDDDHNNTIVGGGKNAQSGGDNAGGSDPLGKAMADRIAQAKEDAEGAADDMDEQDLLAAAMARAKGGPVEDVSEVEESTTTEGAEDDEEEESGRSESLNENSGIDEEQDESIIEGATQGEQPPEVTPGPLDESNKQEKEEQPEDAAGDGLANGEAQQNGEDAKSDVNGEVGNQ